VQSGGGQRGESCQKSQEGAVREVRVGPRAKSGRSKRQELSQEPRNGSQRGESRSKSQVGAVREARVVKRAKKKAVGEEKADTRAKKGRSER